MFEFDEYIHLAAHAARTQDHHASMGYLKQALQQQPRSAVAISMLAGEHAALGLHRRAIQGLATALAIEPRMSAARIQLGLLLLGGNQGKEAKAQFSKLAEGADASLRGYSEGLLALADGQLSVAREKIAAAISAKSGDAMVQTIMKQVLEQLAPRTSPQRAPVNQQASGPEISLGAYRQVSQ
jgi:tetratricopeptide (TPR) repeat protein